MKTTILSIVTLMAASSDALPSFPLKERQIPGRFNAVKQSVSIVGEHAWKAPSASDLRGPCPGLNAMANHGYIPRNGVVTVEQAIPAMQTVYGVAPDFGAFIALLASVFAGDVTSFSIGGPPPRKLIGGGLLGQPQGISFSHNRFEGDASIARLDQYISPSPGDSYTFQLPYFKELLSLNADPSAPYDINVLADHAALRYNHSLHNNPYFFRGFVGALVPPGTSGLASNLFSNKSAEHPGGFLDRETLKAFFGVTGTGDNLQATPGYERIPANWYKYGPENEYNTVDFMLDVGAVYQKHPETLVFGGNTGTTNSMTGVDVANMTGGVFNMQTLLQGNNLGCFIFQGIASNQADLLTRGGIIGDTVTALGKLSAAAGKAIAPLQCNNLAEYAEGQFNIFPGYS